MSKPGCFLRFAVLCLADKPFEYPGIGMAIPGLIVTRCLGDETLALPDDVAARVAPYLDR